MGQEEADTGAPTAEAIVERFIEATGGRGAWESLTSIRGLGTIEVVGAPVQGSVAIYQTADGFRRSVDAGGAGAQVTIRRGDEAWVARPGGGVKPLAGAELLKMQRDQSFNPLLDPSKIYASLTVKGVEEVEGAQAWVIRCVPGNDPEAEDLRYFDIESGLQVKLVQRTSGEGSGIPTEVYLSDYRPVGQVQFASNPYLDYTDTQDSSDYRPVGQVQFAYETMIVAGRGRVQISLQAMQANVSIPACLFDTPDGDTIEPTVEQPRQVLEAFMRADVNTMTVAEARAWIQRLEEARRRIPKDFEQAEAMDHVFRECRRACVQRIAAIESQGDAGSNPQPSEEDQPSSNEHPSSS